MGAMRLKSIVMAAVCASALAAPGFAQNRDQTLADVRQELTVLNVEIKQLKR